MFERWQLEVGDLCIFVGDSDIYKQMRHRVIYQVVSKEEAASSSYSYNRYGLRIAFDIESPSGSSTEVITSHLGTKNMKKLSLLDLATTRLHFDDFIRWWAKTQGMEDTGDREDAARPG
jgi:hypothetical protein